MNKVAESYKVNGYLPTIGIECHVQLKTKTKLFASVGNDARGAEPNSLVSHICLGMPGALPYLNKKVVEYAVRLGFAFNTPPQKYSYFERKHYFYPDLPKGYQITQLEYPIVKGGYVQIEADGQNHRVNLNRVQIEEDAGKLTHNPGKDYSLVDLNRAGTPLLEIVSEPDIHTSEQAKAYARELYLIARYSDISDADMYHGNMRFDVNVSVSKNESKLGTRTETKNLNSFKSVEKAVDYEIARQIKLLENGQTITQETRGWDDAKQKTVSQRGKEEAHDYRYFPEPDVPPINLDDNFINTIKDNMPILPSHLRAELKKLDIDESTLQTLVDNLEAGKFMLGIIKKSDAPSAKRIANWLASDVQALVLDEKLSWDRAVLDQKAFLQLVSMVETNRINSTAAKKILSVIVEQGGDPLLIAQEHDLLQVSDEAEIEKIVQKVLHDNPKAADDVRNGENKAIGFLVGQIMKETKGKANPGLAQKLIKKLLES
jgi:aspartyl-tRNA(Asn)/glutamyl-tRNA(Gln) amidotransferase subunit B